MIAIDNVLIDHDGKLIEDAGGLWDHAERRSKIAHDYLIANYVCPSRRHYPLEFRRFRKEADCEQARRALEETPGGFDEANEADKRRATFKNHTALLQELVDWTLHQGIPGDFTFDRYFTCAANLNPLHEADRGYVGDLKFNRKLCFRGREIKADALADTIGPEDRKPVKIDGKTPWYFTASLRIPDVEHKARIVILWERKNGTKPRKMLVTNRTHWEVGRILGVYRFRWTGTETFHRDGKQHLGMGDCPLRNGEGHTRHMYLVMTAHSLLLAGMSHGRAREGTLAKLKTIGEACRAVLRETLGKTIDWVISHVTQDGWNTAAIREHRALA